MCRYKVLSHNENGYIIKCKGCKSIQLAFGTSAVKFNLELFDSFNMQIKALYETYFCNGFDTQKRIHVDVYTENCLMILTFDELFALKKLLELSEFALEMDNVLEENKIAS